MITIELVVGYFHVVTSVSKPVTIYGSVYTNYLMRQNETKFEVKWDIFTRPGTPDESKRANSLSSSSFVGESSL